MKISLDGKRRSLESPTKVVFQKKIFRKTKNKFNEWNEYCESEIYRNEIVLKARMEEEIKSRESYSVFNKSFQEYMYGF